MRPITLTTTISNPATVPLLLKIADRLVTMDLLDSLRIVDGTSTADETEALRAMLPHDGDSGTRIVGPDIEGLKGVDPSAHVSLGMEGYSHRSTGLRLVPGGRSVYVMTRAAVSSCIAIGPEPKAPGGAEIVLDRSRGFIRMGRGGGTPRVSIDTGIVGAGLGWRGIELRLSSSGELGVKLDTGESMAIDLKPVSTEFVVSISAGTSGVSDFVASYLDPILFERESVARRKYVSYFSCMPAPVDGAEFVSVGDIVHIDVAGWRRMVEGTAAPLVLGDPEHCPIFRRLGVLRESKNSLQVHSSFLERSKGSIDKVEDVASQGIPIVISKSSMFSNRGGIDGLLPPALVCCLDDSARGALELLAGYEALFEDGPRGEKLKPRANDMLVHLDGLMRTDGAEDFLLELLEVLPDDKRKFLFNALNRKLS